MNAGPFAFDAAAAPSRLRIWRRSPLTLLGWLALALCRSTLPLRRLHRWPASGPDPFSTEFPFLDDAWPRA
jgi:hypothetical protein